MRNLKINSIKRFDLKSIISDSERIGGIVAVNNDFYYIKNDGEFCTTQNNQESVLSPEIFVSILAGPEYLSFEDRIWFATDDKLIYYCPKTDTITSIALAKKALCFGWNPTKEILVVVHEDAEVVTYSVDLVNECVQSLCGNNKSSLYSAVPDGVYVGWGSADTQFRGSEGKIKKQPVVEVEIIEDKTPRITWRGNGEMFAVNYWKEGRRTFKVFSQEYCKALYECCDVIGLQAIIAWRPEGNMIANSICLANKYSIGIFEKNGYKRFTFPLIHDDCEVKELKWSQRGDVLVVLQENYLCLYTTSNYKWFLKQQLCFEERLVSFLWSSITDLNLLVFTEGDFFVYNFQMGYDVCVDDGVVAVIDGKCVHLTCFQDACIPPPLAQKTIQSKLNAVINFVVVCNKNQFVLVDSNWFVSIFNDNGEELFSFQIEQQDASVFYNFSWIDTRLFCMKVSKQTEVSVVFFKDDKMVVSLQDLKQLKESHLPSSSHLNSLSLSPPNDFYLNDKCISNSVSSFIVLFENYLLLTTTNNLLYCIRLEHLEKLYSINKNEFFNRPIEQGARLICGVKNSPLIVLQIPRGNLEIVSCRLIAIDILENYLNLNDWRKAIHFLRTDRLNSNLLFDLNPERFLKNIDRFVLACETAVVLNSFIQEIEDGSVLETIYSQCCEKINYFPNKRVAICEALLEYFKQVDYSFYATSIVTIALNHFDIEMALVYIQDLYFIDKNVADVAMKTLMTFTKNESEDYLFKKSLQLYDTNLTRYICGFTQMDPKFYLTFLKDLDAYSEVKRRYRINAYLKKPKIAIQYLIRDETSDFKEILKYIEDNRNVLPNVYGYYNKTKEPENFKIISKLYGEFLYERKLYKEAAIIYTAANLHKEAFQQYKLAKDWQTAITILNTKLFDCYNDFERHLKIVEITNDLISIKNYKEAAQIQEKHLNNYEDAIRTLLNGYHFREALLIVFKHKREDIIVHDIIPAVEKYCLDLEEKILDNKKTFQKYKERLLTLKTAKIHKQNLFSENDIDCDLYSDAGTVTTKSTNSSRSSTRSARNRRKEERKKQDLREGGVYEDIALIRALYVLIEETFKIGPDLREFCLVLLELDLRKEGCYLYHLLKELQREMSDNFKNIWPDSKATISDNVTSTQNINENFSLLDEKYKNPPCLNENLSWELTVFEEMKICV